MQSWVKLLLTAVAIIIVSASCEHKELCYNHHEHAPSYHLFVDAKYQQDWEICSSDKGPDWQNNWDADRFGMSYETLRPSLPLGLRVITNDLATGAYDMHNIASDGGRVYFSGSESALLLYNNDTEYIVFNDLGMQTAATATTRTRTRTTYYGNQFSSEEDENTVAPPDMLYARYLDKVVTVKQLKLDTIEVELRPLVFKYLVRYEITHGMEYLGLARGALSGMAGSVYLHNGHTTEQVVTLIYDCDIVPEWGVKTELTTFGVPNYPNDSYTRGEQRYALNLEVRLRNGEMLTYDFDVTDQVEHQPHGGVIEVGGIEIPDSIGQKADSGFEIEIEGWGEYVDVDLPL